MARHSKVPLVHPDVELRPIDGWLGMYEVAADGRVWSMPRIVIDGRGITRKIRGRWLKAALDGKGYKQVGLHRDGVTHLARVHRLVAVAWLPPAEGGREHVNHKDLDRTNSQATNLEWCTVAENNLHGWRAGSRQVTDKARAALQLPVPAKRLFTAEQVASIRARHAAGQLRQHLADEFKVCFLTIHRMVRGLTYPNQPEIQQCVSN